MRWHQDIIVSIWKVIIGELRMTSLTSDDNRGGVPGGGAPWSPQWSVIHNVSVSCGPGWVSHTILGKLFTRIMIMGLSRIQDKPLQLIVFFSGALIVQSAASCCHCPILCWFGFPGGWETVTDERTWNNDGEDYQSLHNHGDLLEVLIK